MTLAVGTGEATSHVLALPNSNACRANLQFIVARGPRVPTASGHPPRLTLSQKERSKQLPIEMDNVLCLRLCPTHYECNSY